MLRYDADYVGDDDNDDNGDDDDYDYDDYDDDDGIIMIVEV
jgi:hypothetical protein